jgi:hypothetical protein
MSDRYLIERRVKHAIHLGKNPGMKQTVYWAVVDTLRENKEVSRSHTKNAARATAKSFSDGWRKTTGQ